MEYQTTNKKGTTFDISITEVNDGIKTTFVLTIDKKEYMAERYINEKEAMLAAGNIIEGNIPGKDFSLQQQNQQQQQQQHVFVTPDDDDADADDEWWDDNMGPDPTRGE
jgi:hypothetical protein